MTGRIIRPGTEQGCTPELPEVGRIHIGERRTGKNGKEYPASLDYFKPSGKYSGLFDASVGEKPSTLQIVFPYDDPAKVCNERFEYRDASGSLVASGDGRVFRVWDGMDRREFSLDKHPDLMHRIAAKYPTPRGEDNWDIVLTLHFILPQVRGIVGVWGLTTKGRASSINNIRDSFDWVQAQRGTVTGTVFDLSVKFAKSDKPGVVSRYPVLSMVANDNRIEEIRAALAPKDNLGRLLPGKDGGGDGD